ncbi:MAG: capsule assembly Wzi family protein [Bacteroidota bacterium]|nr:capsule assembly Wzi family protein [Bacteroidota bacterium]
MYKILLLLFPIILSSQSVYLSATHPIYKYLDKMEAKQVIVGYRDAVKPLSRETIAKFIVQIDTTSMELTQVEQEEQFYYKEEFFQELENIGYENIIEERWHLYQYKSNPGNFNIDLIGGYSYHERADGKTTKVTSNGLNAYGYLGKHVGAYFMFRDNSESGSYINSSRPLSPEPAQVIARNLGSFINYDPIDAQVNVDFDFVTLSVEKMHNVWGSGEQGNIILSNKAPSFPQIKLRARLGENVDFTYIHGWLYSDIIDSLHSYQVSNVPGSLGFRRVNRQKYIAAHMIEFTPWDGIDLSIGESEVYGSRSPELLYLIPFMFFKAGEHWMYDTDNSQMFISADLNFIKNQNYYFSLFLDEFSTEDFARTDRQRNQLGFTIGTKLYDHFISDSRILIEYTRMNPWVYNHKFSDATFQSHKINLGHWIGQNADLFSIGFNYKPIRSLEVGLVFESLRKGGKDSTIFQYKLPTPTFLYSPLTKQQTFGIVGSYEPLRDFIIDFRILQSRFTTQVTNTSYSYSNNPNDYYIGPEFAKKWDIFIGMRYNFD